MSEPNPQPLSRRPVLMPALVEAAFDYLMPEGTETGALVEATLAGRTLVGVVWEREVRGQGSEVRESTVPTAKLKPVLRVLDLPPRDDAFRRWIDWISDYTLAPKGAVLSLCALQYAAKTTRKKYHAEPFTFRLPELSESQRHVAQQLVERMGQPKPILLDGVTGSGKTEVYFHAMAAVLAGSRFQVPGSGEALEAETWNPEPGAQILILLPEITLTHQWLARFEATFGAAPIVWHSGMTPAAKARAWQAVARGEASVVVGARSALFLPFQNLALIIVDEEHDASYKQDEGVIYHARDMAVARAHFARIPILLASATPSLETLENVRLGKYQALQLASRYGPAQLPEVTLVDLRNDPPERGDFIAPSVRRAALETLARGEQVLFFLNRRGYAPLLLCRACGHRFQCADCSAWLVVHKGRGRRSEVRGQGGADSRALNSPLEGESKPSWVSVGGPISEASPPTDALKKRVDSPSRGELQALESAPTSLASGPWPPASLCCHHCNHREPMPTHCPECNADAEQLVACGPGVERIAEEVRGMFAPHHEPRTTNHEPRILTLSSDTAIPPETWASIARGEVDILVGTQMVAKGHDFPKLTLVVVVDADVGLDGADLRAVERSYQMLHQLGGRAGRGELPGRVLVQTYAPDHPLMKALAAHDRDRLMRLEAKERAAGGWPPFGGLAAILLDGKDDATVRAAAQALARRAPNDPRLSVLGPAPAPLSKLRGQYRYRLLVKTREGIHLQRTLRQWLSGQKFKGVRIKLDVNPYYFM